MTIAIINGQEKAVPPYGCHNRADFPETVSHSSGSPQWPFVMSRTCNYDRADNDARCSGCRHMPVQQEAAE